MKSIMEPKGCKTCYVCGCEYGTHEHHVIYGTGKKPKAEKYGLKVHLCQFHHQDAKQGVHGGNIELRDRLRREGQLAFERDHTRKEFIAEFGISYLDATEADDESD